MSDLPPDPPETQNSPPPNPPLGGKVTHEKEDKASSSLTPPGLSTGQAGLKHRPSALKQQKAHLSEFGAGLTTGPDKLTPPKGLYRLQPPAARLVAATNVTSVYQTDVTLAAPTDTLCLCSNVSVGPANIKSVWATDVTSVASGRRYRGGL
ncbi:hypothetical protein PCANC_05069 [Puccinia coronata f. sp. avenae]|uniref:Uncharacterized protein n=1 Tax=Puccinia coronata f. sp. avenae TaxID=200324 RepID=A0A2N5T708_9BASI|nr:hypothetical protein PCANC_05069 [Puccinia coronata f. sp. avenae]